ncbi:hypothetical protein GGR50DRAFT_695861 [Xylaria sp. CBS 124048]|nr:hypothetical protein GGR50DRAFT_695861 [Xylaria sp. CBS 124048]
MARPPICEAQSREQETDQNLERTRLSRGRDSPNASSGCRSGRHTHGYRPFTRRGAAIDDKATKSETQVNDSLKILTERLLTCTGYWTSRQREFTVHGLRSTVYGLRSTVYGLLSTVYLTLPLLGDAFSVTAVVFFGKPLSCSYVLYQREERYVKLIATGGGLWRRPRRKWETAPISSIHAVDNMLDATVSLLYSATPAVDVLAVASFTTTSLESLKLLQLTFHHDMTPVKRGDMDVSGSEPILSEFHGQLAYIQSSSLCRELRDILFPRGARGRNLATPFASGCTLWSCPQGFSADATLSCVSEAPGAQAPPDETRMTAWQSGGYDDIARAFEVTTVNVLPFTTCSRSPAHGGMDLSGFESILSDFQDQVTYTRHPL